MVFPGVKFKQPTHKPPGNDLLGLAENGFETMRYGLSYPNSNIKNATLPKKLRGGCVR